MRLGWHLFLTALLAVSLLAACGGDDDGGEGGASGVTQDDATGDDATGDDTVLVTIGSGDDAGDYERKDVVANCSVGLVAEEVFGVQYSDFEVTEGLSSLQAIVRSEDNFSTTATIGAEADGTSYDITDGTATVDIDSDTPTLTVEGATDDGTEVTVVVECASVVRS